MSRGIPGIAFVDFLAAMLVAFVALLLISLLAVKVQAKTPPLLRTQGTYAIVTTWDGSRDEDVDTYVGDPSGHVLFFANPTVGLLHLEQDVLGNPSSLDSSGVAHKRKRDQERVVMRGIETGSFAVNVHLYRQGTGGPTPVTVELWQLVGADHPVLTQRVVLQHKGSEVTAFRFTVTPAGTLTGFNRLPTSLLGSAWKGSR